jgi:hypothetical protein
MTRTLWPRFITLSALSFAVLFQYQNCAPAGKNGAAVSDADNVVHAMGTGGATQAVKLNSALVHFSANQAEASVSGTCVENHTPTLSWSLRDPQTGEDLGDGSTACVNDTFNMQLATTQRMECDRVYDFQVNDAQGTVTKDCQN